MCVLSCLCYNYAYLVCCRVDVVLLEVDDFG
jgi:hypothetical protein